MALKISVRNVLGSNPKQVYEFQPRKSQRIFAVSFSTKTKGLEPLKKEEGTERIQTTTNITKKLF